MLPTLCGALQINILRTIGGVDNIHRFPARANDAMLLLREVDGDPAALVDVFHDLSALLATQSVAHKLIETMRASVSAAQVRPDPLMAACMLACVGSGCSVQHFRESSTSRRCMAQKS